MAAQRLDSIQLIRYIAALAVVCVHVPTLQFGHWGVDVFFAISGFIMVYTTERSTNRFFLRRVIRVAPLYWLITLSVFAVALAAPTLLNNTTANFVHLAKSLFFVPFDKNGAGHFPVLFVGWTLNYEFAFYSLFAISLLISVKHRVFVTSLLILCLVVTSKVFEEKSFILQTYGNGMLFEFVYGMLLFLAWKRVKGWPDRSQAVLAILLAGALVLSLRLDVDVRWIDAGIPSLLGVFVGLLFLSKFTLPAFSILLGDASYALYLTHPYTIQLMEKVLGWFAQGGAIAVVATLLAIVVTTSISVLVFKFIENPMSTRLRRALC